MQKASREKMILAGLFLSKFDEAGLQKLGFESFAEAFNVLGFATGGNPSSIKNYRDEFDPLFPNARRGWHKRPTRPYCLEVLRRYATLNIDEFASLLKSLIPSEARVELAEELEDVKEAESTFAKRLITGLAAESYFQAVQPKVPELKDYSLENMTTSGCGYDFRLNGAGKADFLAVEVKGLAERSGNLSLTAKEHKAAESLAEKFILFVVKNFRETPYHEMFWNPLAGDLHFTRRERIVVQVSWLAAV